MNQQPEVSRSAMARRHRPTSLDLILQARALRHEWFVSALARLSAKLAAHGAELGARARPTPAVSERSSRTSAWSALGAQP